MQVCQHICPQVSDGAADGIEDAGRFDGQEGAALDAGQRFSC